MPHLLFHHLHFTMSMCSVFVYNNASKQGIRLHSIIKSMFPFACYKNAVGNFDDVL